MKAQISIEFIVGVAVLLFIYTFALGIFSSYSQQDIVMSEKTKQVCYTVASTIDSASIGGSGFSLNATIPKNEDSGDYAITVNNSIVSVDSGKRIFSCSTTTQSVMPLQFGSEKFSATNINGTVYISAIQANSTCKSGKVLPIKGAYFLGNVSLTIINASGSVALHVNAETSNNTFYYNWTPASKGEYSIIASDTAYKNLNSKKVIVVL